MVKVGWRRSRTWQPRRASVSPTLVRDLCQDNRSKLNNINPKHYRNIYSSKKQVQLVFKGLPAFLPIYYLFQLILLNTKMMWCHTFNCCHRLQTYIKYEDTYLAVKVGLYVVLRFYFLDRTWQVVNAWEQWDNEMMKLTQKPNEWTWNNRDRDILQE